MWTGDFESTYPTQWALNPSAYQDIPSEQGQYFLAKKCFWEH